MTAVLAVTSTPSGGAAGTVTSSSSPVSGTNINCATATPVLCSYPASTAATVTLTATPSNATSAFNGWTGTGASACAAGTAPNICTLAMTQARAVTATFVPGNSLTVTNTPTSGATGTVTSSAAGINCGSTCSYNFPSGNNVTLTATPSSATSAFSGWTGTGAAACAAGTAPNVCTLSMTAARAVTATFVPGFALTVSKAGGGTGTVTSSAAGINCGSTCTYNFPASNNVTLTAAPTANSVFTGWSGTGAGTCADSTETTCIVPMTAAKAVTANFVPGRIINVDNTGSGDGEVQADPEPANVECTMDSCAFLFQATEAVTLTAVADPGSAFTGWGGACEAFGTDPCEIGAGSTTIEAEAEFLLKPVTSIVSSSLNKKKGAAKFKFRSSISGSRFQCSIDGKGFYGCTTPKTYKNLKKKGKHVFKVRAIFDGVTGPIVKFQWNWGKG